MPRIPDAQVTDDQLYGVTKVDNTLSFEDRTRKRWRPGDTVEVRNFTDQTIRWQWLDEQDESYAIEDDTNIKITERERPGAWELGPGETDVLPGSCAYRFADSFYKLLCIMKTGIVINPLSEREIRNFSLDDPERQEQFLDMMIVGKITPSAMQKAALAQFGAAAQPGVRERLQPLATERDEWQRRQEAAQRMQRAPSQLQDLADEFDPGATLLGTATGGLPTDDNRKVPTAPEPPEDEQKPTGAPTPPDGGTEDETPKAPTPPEGPKKPEDTKPQAPKPNPPKPVATAVK